MSKRKPPSDNPDIVPWQLSRGPINVMLVSSVALSFIGFWRAAAIVLSDLASTAYYIGGISEQAIGEAAAWFVLGVMCFSYVVRMVYMESCTIFTRGGVYRVVKEALGGFLAKVAVSALLFDFILTGPISAISAAKYLVGLVQSLLLILWDVKMSEGAGCAMAVGIAVATTAYFWRANLLGIGESSGKALKILKLTAVMTVVVIIWSVVTILFGERSVELPAAAPVLTHESKGWLASFPRIVGLFGIAIAFGHSLLAMSGEEALAQVYREIASPKVKNLKRAAGVIFVFAFTLTGIVTLLAFVIVPSRQRIVTEVVVGETRMVVDRVIEKDGPGARLVAVTDGRETPVPPGGKIVRRSGEHTYTENLLGGLAMNVVGPRPVRVVLQAFVVLVGFVLLSGAVNTSMIGANGTLNRVAEDGVLTPWFLHPQKRYGTTHRIINIIALLQVATILASMGDVYVLGEAYAFGVVWSFVFTTFSMMVLRFKDRSPREYKVPLNVQFRMGGRSVELPVGILLVFAVLLGTAVINLLTKKVATVWGLGFTAAFLCVFLVSERITVRRRGRVPHEHLEQFNEQIHDDVTAEGLLLEHPAPVLVALRNPQSDWLLGRVLERVDTRRRDVVVITCQVLPAFSMDAKPDVRLRRPDEELLTRVVTVAENLGKTVHPVVLATNNPLFAIAKAARSLNASQVVLGVSRKIYAETQLEEFAMAWGMATAETPSANPISVTIMGPTDELVQEIA